MAVFYIETITFEMALLFPYSGFHPKPHLLFYLDIKEKAEKIKSLHPHRPSNSLLREQKELACGSNSFLFFPSLHCEGARLRIPWTVALFFYIALFF